MIKGRKIHFIGIGGIGMSGLAKILLAKGYEVSGSDISDANISDLKNLGALVFDDHNEENIIGADTVVYSAAIREDNPELKKARELGLTIYRRSELLGELMSEKKGIAVAGTHGKTTTSTMLSLVLEEAGFDPTIAIGGEVKNIGGNSKYGLGEYFVAEACEYERSFLDLSPFAAIITNIEEEHLDTYKDLDDIINTFKKFIGQINPQGFLVISGSDKNLAKINGSFGGEIITYGFGESEFIWEARDIKIVDGITYFQAFYKNAIQGEVSLLIPGNHNVLNALSVIAATRKLGVDFGTIERVLSEFEGVKRRFQIKGEKNGITVIDDYAHHPTEIKATLLGLRNMLGQFKGKIWCVFQAHQYSRTKLLLSDFAQSFREVDQVIVTEIYRARDTEEDVRSINGEILTEEINKVSKNAIYISEFKEATNYLLENAKAGDVIITLGAGPVYKIGEFFLEENSKSIYC